MSMLGATSDGQRVAGNILKDGILEVERQVVYVA